MARGPLTRAGTHHPGPIAHLYYGSQIAYLLATHLKKAVLLLDEHEKAGTLDTLREQALERLPVPEPVDPKCAMPGDQVGGGRSYSWLEVWPGQQNRNIRQLIKSGSWKWIEWFSPGEGGRFMKGWGHHDVHGGIEHKNQNETDSLVMEIPIPKFLEKNHVDGRVWLCFYFVDGSKSMNSSHVTYHVNGKPIDLDNGLDDTDYKHLFQSNKAQLYNIEDERPQKIPSGGFNIAAVPAGQVVRVQVDGFISLRHIWVY